MPKSNAADALTPADLVVLATAAVRPAHGYDLWKRLEAADVKDWAPVSKAQIYYSLKKLAAQGLLAVRAAKGKPAGPEREVFAATAAGRAALKKNLAAPHWAEHREPSPFTTWAALSLILSPAEKRVQARRRRAFLKAELAREEATLKALAPYDAADADLARSLIGLVKDLFCAELAWLDRFEAEFAGSEATAPR